MENDLVNKKLSNLPNKTYITDNLKHLHSLTDKKLDIIINQDKNKFKFNKLKELLINLGENQKEISKNIQLVLKNNNNIEKNQVINNLQKEISLVSQGINETYDIVLETKKTIDSLPSQLQVVEPVNFNQNLSQQHDSIRSYYDNYNDNDDDSNI